MGINKCGCIFDMFRCGGKIDYDCFPTAVILDVRYRGQIIFFILGNIHDNNVKVIIGAEAFSNWQQTDALLSHIATDNISPPNRILKAVF